MNESSRQHLGRLRGMGRILEPAGVRERGEASLERGSRAGEDCQRTMATRRPCESGAELLENLAEERLIGITGRHLGPYFAHGNPHQGADFE